MIQQGNGRIMDVTKGILVTLIWATQGSQAVTSAQGVVLHECCGSDLNREVLLIPDVYKLEVSPGTQYNMHSCYPRI